MINIFCAVFELKQGAVVILDEEKEIIFGSIATEENAQRDLVELHFFDLAVQDNLHPRTLKVWMRLVSLVNRCYFLINLGLPIRSNRLQQIWEYNVLVETES